MKIVVLGGTGLMEATLFVSFKNKIMTYLQPRPAPLIC